MNLETLGFIDLHHTTVIKIYFFFHATAGDFIRISGLFPHSRSILIIATENTVGIFTTRGLHLDLVYE